MPLVDVSLLFTPISLMICMTSFPGTWVESLMRCRGWLSPAESAARDRLQTAGSTAGWVSRTRDTEGHCHALAPLPKRMTGTGRGKYSDSQPDSQTSPIIFIWYSIWLAMLALLSLSRLLWYKIFTRAAVGAQKGERARSQSWADPGSFSGVQWVLTRSVGPGMGSVRCVTATMTTHCVSIKIIQLIARQECVSNRRVGKWWLWNQAWCQTLGVNTDIVTEPHTARLTAQAGGVCSCSLPRLCTKGWQVKRKDRLQPEKQMSTESIQVSRQLIFGQKCSSTGGASNVFAIIVFDENLHDAYWLWWGRLWPGRAGESRARDQWPGWPGHSLPSSHWSHVITASSHSGLAMGPVTVSKDKGERLNAVRLGQLSPTHSGVIQE